MKGFVKSFINAKGYEVNTKAQQVIEVCDNWYANREDTKFHKRKTIQGIEYQLSRLNFAKRCCSDDANLCEVLEINAGGKEEQNKYVNAVLEASEFNTQYRKQLEKISATGTVACYVRLDGVEYLDNGKARGGMVRLNYVNADGFIPLTVENDIVIEAAFSGTALKGGREETTVVLFLCGDTGLYMAETHVFDWQGTEIKEQESTVNLGPVKPFAVMRNAEVNNLDNMEGYGLPKLWNAIPMLKALDLSYNVLYSDLDKAEKVVLISEVLCDFDEEGRAVMSLEQKKLFVLLGEGKLPGEKTLIQEYNPIIRIDEITKAFELNLSLLSMMFGYGTKKYSFEGGQIKTATEYVGERQDALQELNRQRQEAARYIQDLCRAVLWFSNTFQGKNWNWEDEICINFDDSFITDRNSELESKRSDALSFSQISELTIWYLMDRYNLTEKEAEKIYGESQPDEDDDSETED